MDGGANSDLFFLHDEKFDFDVSLSPASSKGDEDEDEVFVDPVNHKEKCADVVSRLQDSAGAARTSWSPLTGDQLEAVCQEAHRLAVQLQSSEPKQLRGKDEQTAGVTLNPLSNEEQFVYEAEAKLGLLGQPASMCSPIKRQTFCVEDSPMKELPPAIQRRLLGGSTSAAASSTRSSLSTRTSCTRLAATAGPATRLSMTARLSTSSPASGAKAVPRTALRGKAMLGVTAVLPSKPTAVTTSCSTSKSRVVKTRLQPPSKAAVGRKQSPSSRPSSRAQSCEDLLSDSTSVASDVSDCSLNSSLVGKRTLAPPTKNAVRNLSGVKAPPLQNRKVANRKNTSSSSSTGSSINSSLSVSPKGKLNSSLNLSLTNSTGPTPRSISRPASQIKQRRSIVNAPTEPSSFTAGRRRLSTQARKLSEAEHSKAAKTTPLKRAEATALQPTPAKRVMERTASIPSATTARSRSGLKAKPRPQALVAPTPSGGDGGIGNGEGASSPDVQKMLKPKRLMSVNSITSLPQKSSAGPLTPSAGSCKLLQMKACRPSALPTPLKRRTSTIPIATPTSHSRPAKPPASSDSGQTSARRETSCSPASVDTQGEEPVDAPHIKPFCLEEEEPAAISPPAVLELSLSESPDAGTLSQDESEPKIDLIELGSMEESNSMTKEVLLLDLPAPTLQPQEKLLIDLTNTPDLIRTSGKTCTTSQQLIDLSSPLIKWSPDDKKNIAPLINLSF
ncbi:G2 and S phase-expressed protein 1 [Aulostomus maculatus]